MPSRMKITGVGPRVALCVLPYAALAAAAMVLRPGLLRMQCSRSLSSGAAIALGALWLALYVGSGRALVKGFPRGELMTRGAYALCRHPLYASVIYFGIPALAFALRSWLVMTIAVAVWVACALLVGREERALAEAFGDAYRGYAARVNRFLPIPRFRSGPARAAAALAAVGVTLFVGYATAIRPWFLHWGATDEEAAMALPGDALLPGYRSDSTRAITIGAPVEQVWPWLVQMGQTRGGLYSYEGLENLFGCDMHNADRIEPRWQGTQPGDEFRLDPRVPPLTVAALEPNRAFVVAAGPRAVPARPGSDGPADAGPPATAVAWAFVTRPVGAEATRLIVRWRSEYPPGLLSALVNQYLLEPVHFAMERRMMLGIQERAERLARGS